MRHNKKINHLGRTNTHRDAMLSNMACSLIKHKRIFTTTAKAKALRKFVEPLITKSQVELAEAGRMSLKDFAASSIRKDILTHIFIPGGKVEAVYLSQRNCATDFPVLTCALARREGKVACAVGARPARAARFDDEAGLLAGGVTEESAAAFAEDVARRAVFGSNTRGSAEYRRQVCRALVRRAALKLEEK